MKAKSRNYLADMRAGKALNTKEQSAMLLRLALPAILAQMTSIIMQYIDASMVGHLGANASAAIGLLGPCTWLFGSLGMAAITGFTVQIAQAVGAGKEAEARGLVRIGIVCVLVLSFAFAGIGVLIHASLPKALGGAPEILPDASVYFLVYALTLPVMAIQSFAAGALEASGNMRFPSGVQILMCVLDVVYNRALIYGPEEVAAGPAKFTLPGAGLGVLGAALGTSLSQLTGMIILILYLLLKPSVLKPRKNDGIRIPVRPCIVRAVKLATPVAIEQSVLCTAQIAVIRIISPLGTIAVAANSLAVTTESFCYMPGYGISSAAVTVVGQAVGAGRKDITKRLGILCTALGCLFMTVTGALLYLFAPQLMQILTPVPEIVGLGARCLRVEAIAEPLFAASIVVAGVFRGAGNTLDPSLINLISIWAVRIPLAALLSPRIGLLGAWIGMACDVSIRGILFLVRLFGKRWIRMVFPE